MKVRDAKKYLSEFPDDFELMHLETKNGTCTGFLVHLQHAFWVDRDRKIVATAVSEEELKCGDYIPFQKIEIE